MVSTRSNQNLNHEDNQVDDQEHHGYNLINIRNLNSSLEDGSPHVDNNSSEHNIPPTR